jgi:choline dehydrogenase-like flavoprotein
MAKMTTHSNVKRVGPPHSAQVPSTTSWSASATYSPKLQTLKSSSGVLLASQVANKPTPSGSITITSCNLNDLPAVVPNYLHTSLDRESARELVRTSYGVISSPPMQSVESPINLGDSIVNSDALLDEYIHSLVTSTYHSCATCGVASLKKGGAVD